MFATSVMMQATSFRKGSSSGNGKPALCCKPSWQSMMWGAAGWRRNCPKPRGTHCAILPLTLSKTCAGQRRRPVMGGLPEIEQDCSRLFCQGASFEDRSAWMFTSNCWLSLLQPSLPQKAPVRRFNVKHSSVPGFSRKLTVFPGRGISV